MSSASNLVRFTGCIVLGMLSISCSSEELETDRPKKTASTHQFQPESSNLNVSIEAPYELIRSAAQSNFDKFKEIKIDDSLNCSPAVGGLPCSAGYRGKIYIERKGPVTVQKDAAANALVISVPLSLKGQVGFRGWGAEKLSLDKKNLDGAATVSAKIELGITNKWAPTASVILAQKWTSRPRIEVAHNLYVTVEDEANKAIKKELKNLPKIIEKQLSTINLEEKIRKVWKNYLVPIPNSENTDNIVIKVTPQQAFFTGFQYGTDRVRAGLGLEAITAVYVGNPPKEQQLPLGELSTKIRPEPGFALHVPVFASYASLTSILKKALGGKTFKAKTDMGDVSVSVNDVEVFPSSDRLAIGVNISADVPGRILDVNGEIFLMTLPKISSDGRVVNITNTTFYRSLDNEIWKAVSFIFQKEIIQALEHLGKYDLTDDIEKAKLKIAEELVAIGRNSNVSVNLSDETLKLVQILPDSQYLIAAGIFSGKLKLISSAP